MIEYSPFITHFVTKISGANSRASQVRIVIEYSPFITHFVTKISGTSSGASQVRIARPNKAISVFQVTGLKILGSE